MIILSIDMPLRNDRTTDCKSCYTNTVYSGTPRLYLLGYGYICLECAIKLEKEINNKIKEYEALMSKAEYVRVLVSKAL